MQDGQELIAVSRRTVGSAEEKEIICKFLNSCQRARKKDKKHVSFFQISQLKKKKPFTLNLVQETY